MRVYDINMIHSLVYKNITVKLIKLKIIKRKWNIIKHRNVTKCTEIINNFFQFYISVIKILLFNYIIMIDNDF